MIATLITGHDDLSDWSFLLALVALVLALVLSLLSYRPGAPAGATGALRGALVPLALLGAALVALGLLVI